MIRIFLTVAFVASLQLPTAFAETPLRIGVSVPLTGDAALYGADIRDSIVFANKELAGNRYELVIEDDQCNEKSAVTAAHKLTSQDHVAAVIGFGCSGAVLGAAPIYEKSKTLTIASATGAPAITQSGDYIFRTIPSLNIAAQKLYRHAARHHKRVGIISEESAYCQGLKTAFNGENVAGAVEIIEENFLPDVVDFRPLFLKLKAKDVDALFLNPQTEVGLVRLVKQLRELNWNPALYAAYYPSSPTYLKEFGSSGDGIVFADLPFPNQYLTPAGMRIYDDYRKAFGEPKSGDYNIILSILAFEALDRALRSGVEPKAFLYDTRFNDLVDDFGFDRNGDVSSSKVTFVLKTVKDGRVAAFEEQP